MISPLSKPKPARKKVNSENYSRKVMQLRYKLAHKKLFNESAADVRQIVTEKRESHTLRQFVKDVIRLAESDAPLRLR
jgi:hypothetical protein